MGLNGQSVLGSLFRGLFLINISFLMSLKTSLAKVIAHRGLSSLAPENTYAAIELAAKRGATWVEIDVNVSADGIPYLHHDDKLDRCTDGHGYLVREHSSELDKLDAGSWFSDNYKSEPLLRLERLFPLIEKYKLGVNLEIKPSIGWELPATNAICDLVQDSWPSTAPLLISSFNKTALRQARKRLPAQNLGLLVVAIPHNWEVLMKEYECNTFHCAWEFLGQPQVEAIHSKGYPILAYTVDEAEAAQRLMDIGVDSIFSNRPIQLLSELKN